jgi:hypothetical protein
MIHAKQSPSAGGADGLGETSLLGGFDGSEIPPNPAVTQAKIELLREDIVETIGPMIASLQAAVAMGHIPNDAGLIFGLRSAAAYWKSISWSARELQRLRGNEDHPATDPTGGRS